MNEQIQTDKPKRLQSIDALRGFDMLWISGGQKIIYALMFVTGWPAFKWLHGQMEHVKWEGFAFEDLIFPLFLFLAGVSMPFSFAKRKQKGHSKSKIYRHAFIRMVLLVLLGLFYNRILQFDAQHFRLPSVLARIGIAWFLAAIIYLNASLRWQLLWFWGLLIGYCMLMLWVPVPGYGAGVLTPEGNLAGYIDRSLLPGKLYLGVMDPEGVLSTIPAVSTALLGVFAGQFLRLKKELFSQHRKAYLLMAAGVLSLLMGWAWGLFFPIIKNLWTSSFTLYAGGWSLLFLGFFYLVIDVWGFRKWAFFFVVIGMNPITIYLVQYRIIQFDVVRDTFLGGLIRWSPPGLQQMLIAIGYVSCVWLFLYLLYRRKIFLKV